MRKLLAVALLVPSLALAQVAKGATPHRAPAPAAAKAPPPADPTPVTPAVSEPAPAQAAQEATPRLFATVDAWKLEAGQHVLELAGEDTIAEASQPEVLVRARVGLTEHFEVGVGQGVSKTVGQAVGLTSTPVTVRYAPASKPGEVPANPVLEAEWAPRSFTAYQARVRLLLSGEPVPGMAVAANLYAGQDFGRTTSVGGQYGATFGASHPLEVLGHALRVGGEGRLGIADEDGQSPRLVVLAGPSLQARVGPVGLAGAALLDLSRWAVTARPVATLSYAF